MEAELTTDIVVRPVRDVDAEALAGPVAPLATAAPRVS